MDGICMLLYHNLILISIEHLRDISQDFTQITSTADTVLKIQYLPNHCYFCCYLASAIVLPRKFQKGIKNYAITISFPLCFQ